jgi:e3 binding domain.
LETALEDIKKEIIEERITIDNKGDIKVERPLAAPAVRKLARELGVDLS